MSGAGFAAAPAVCLFCHPDDEFAIFAEIESMAAAGRRVVCVYLTDGAYGDQSARRRADESRRVLSRLGVAAGDVHFPGWDLGIGDTKLYQRMGEATDAARRVTDAVGASLILIPAWEGGHHDHDAAHLIGLVLARAGGDRELLQFSIYQGRGLPGMFFRVMSPIPENGEVIARETSWTNRLRYLGFYWLYPSQWKTWLALYPLVVANYLFVGVQRLQKVDPARVLQPPHAGVLLYERRGFFTWKEFAEVTADIRATVAAPRP